MDFQSRYEPRLQGLLAFALLLSSALVFLWSDASLDIDDALISYRYAENLAAGRGFSYNPGERIIGTSTPLYTLILAAGRSLGIPVPRASNSLDLIASVACVGLTLALAAELTGSFAAGLVAGLALLGSSSFVRFSMAGMETPLYTLVLLATLLAALSGRPLLAAGLAGVAVLFRLDGLAVAGALCLALLIERRRVPLRESLVVAALVAPWLMFAAAWSGSPLPHSLLAKREHLASAGGSAFWIWDHLFVRPWSGAWPLLPFAALGLLRALGRGAPARRWAASLLFLALYLAAYTLAAIPFYEWYLMPALPVLAALSASGMHGALELLARRAPDWSRNGLLALVAALTLFPYFREMRPSVAGFKDYIEKVEGTRDEVGRWLRERTRAGDCIATGAVGHVGYASGRCIMDTNGLVTPLGDEWEAPRYNAYRVLEEPNDDPRCSALRVFETGLAAEPRQIAVWQCHPDREVE